jgi:hypothetical protein
MYIDGKFISYVLEDPLRKYKIQDETAIPCGTYYCEYIDSPKFGPNTLWIKNVPGYSHIRVHGGNDENDTSGCLLLGTHRNLQDGTIWGSKPALVKMDAHIDKSKPIVMTISDAIGIE